MDEPQEERDEMEEAPVTASVSEPVGDVRLSVRGLSKRYQDMVAVDDLSFDVRAGEILGVLGPNGAGKTTTLRSVVGVLPLQSGEVYVGGHHLVDAEVEAKKCLAWVPDDPTPFDTLTVHEHLEFTAQLSGVTDWQTQAEELLTRFELAEKRDALGGELSRGMRQKLAFCCSWISQPQVILMDEPLSGLDPRGIRAAKDAIRELAQQGAAVVISSHLLELIEELADRLLIINRGRSVFSGTLAEARGSLAGNESSRLEEIFLRVTEHAEPSDEDLGSPS
jgi:ABC-2 type transport system ATP-binding protein